MGLNCVIIKNVNLYCSFSVNEDTLEKFPNRKIFERGIGWYQQLLFKVNRFCSVIILFLNFKLSPCATLVQESVGAPSLLVLTAPKCHGAKHEDSGAIKSAD